MTAFPLFHSHLDLAHQFCKQILKPGDLAIDATCGNGHDTLFIAPLILTPTMGTLHTFDIQQLALDQTKELLKKNLSKPLIQRIILHKKCHSQFSPDIQPESVSLIVYNLGYLPSGDKSITTVLNTTSQSVSKALTLIQLGGLISITCYPGHVEGQKEEEALLQWSKALSPKEWSCSYHRLTNRHLCPSLFLIQKKSKDQKSI